MASVLKPGETILTGVAREPEVRELARMLQQMGAHLEGAGSEQIRIRGAVQLKGICRRVITDRIVTGTYLIAAAVTRGEVLLQDVSPMENRAILQILEDMGCQINGDEKQRWIHLRAPEYLKAVSAVTGPYPEFPTDLQAMLVTAMSQAEGISHIEETVFENRFRYVEALRRMGAKVSVKENRATVWGRCSLVGSELWATDLRAGAAMVLAGLAAQGKSRIYHLNYVERGYESIASDLFALGAQIRECVE